jgi:hypothetical protein
LVAASHWVHKFEKNSIPLEYNNNKTKYEPKTVQQIKEKIQHNRHKFVLGMFGKHKLRGREVPICFLRERKEAALIKVFSGFD